MTRVFLPTGRVVYLPECEFVDEGRIVSRLDGRTVPVTVRRRVVDARYLEGRIPATSAPPFAVAEGVRCIPTGGLARLAHPAGRFTVIGAGKTALDTCVWLLERGVDPADVTWIKPREGWWPNRRYLQPHDLVVDQYVANAAQIEAMAQATTVDDLFARLDEQGILLRVDPSVPPTMFHGAIVGEAEIALLRRIEDVVRLGHVRTVERDRIILDDGIIPTTRDTLHLHCAASGLVRPPLRPIFGPGRITLQPMFWGTVSFQYAMLGVVEAELHDDDQKNELCRPLHLWDRNVDFLISYAALMANARARGQHPAVSAWSRTSRLYPFAELERYADDPRLPEARGRSRAHAAGALSNLPGSSPRRDPAIGGRRSLRGGETCAAGSRRDRRLRLRARWGGILTLLMCGWWALYARRHPGVPGVALAGQPEGWLERIGRPGCHGLALVAVDGHEFGVFAPELKM